MSRKSEVYDDHASNVSGASWKSATSNPRSYYSSTSNNIVATTSRCSHHHKCHRHNHGHHHCYCIKHFYEDDELCRKNENGELEFGIVSRYETAYDTEGNKEYKIFWTLDNEIEEEDLHFNHPDRYRDLRLVDRKVQPGDIVYQHKKRGEVVGVSWQCYLRILENGMGLLNIPCERLEPLLPYFPGQRVELSGWIGTITSICTEATLMFSGGKTAVIDCSGLPSDQQPYPGRHVKYTQRQYADAGLEYIEDTLFSELFPEDRVEAFVLFLNVAGVEVSWNGRIQTSTGEPIGSSSTECELLSGEADSMPPAVLSRSQLKKRVKILGTPADVDWDETPEVVDRLYQYTVQPTDKIIPDSRKGIEDYLVRKYFNYEEVDDKLDEVVGNKLVSNMSYIVRVLRFSRIIKVKWSRSGKMDRIRASKVTSKHSFQQPFRQIVQKKVSLASFTDNEYGITLGHDTNDMVSVLWMSKSHDSSGLLTFRMKHNLSEPIYDIEPHYEFGVIQPKEVVYRSTNCRLPEALFTVGWVRQITLQGQVIVVSIHTKQEHSVFPPEIETTGIKIHSPDPSVASNYAAAPVSMLKLHSLNTLRIADQLFTINVQNQIDWRGIPETDHFKLLPRAPTAHSFHDNKFSVKKSGMWMKAVMRDQAILSTQVNEEIGTIWIKGFRDRMDLFSVLMAAPPGTPFEGGLYTFDLQLVPEYPSSPPAVYLTSVLSPNSKLHPGFHSLELGDILPPHTLVESLITLQTHIFTKGAESLELPSSAASLQRREASRERQNREANAQSLVDVLDLMFRMVMDPPKLWIVEVVHYFNMTFDRTKARLQALIDLRNPHAKSDEWIIPTFPLLPLTDGFTEGILNRIKRFEELMSKDTLTMDYNFHS